MTTTHKRSAATDSLGALRSRHAELMRSLATRELGSQELALIHEFMEAGAASGAYLDAAADREAAQGILDYWKATLYTSRNPLEHDSHLWSQSAAVLEDYDAVTMSRIVDDVEARLSALQERIPNVESIVRCTLLQLVSLPEDATEFSLVARERTSLSSCGNDADLGSVLAAFESAGAISSSTGAAEDRRVRLTRDALTRAWPRLAGLLERRVLFREAAQFWDTHHRDQGALFTGTLLDESSDYQDLNTLESDFTRACNLEANRLKAKHRREVFAWRSIAALIFALSVVAIGLSLVVIWKTREVAQLEAAKKEAIEANSIADSRSAMALMLLMQQREENPDAVHVVKKVQLLQALGSVAFADSANAREAALDNWKLFVDSVQKNLKNFWFMYFLAAHKADVDAITNVQSTPSKVRQGLLRVSKDLRRVIDEDEEKFLDPLKAMRQHWMQQAVAAARQLVIAADQGRTFETSSHYANRFWRLYCGELVLVEAGGVATAMINFGKQLNAWEASGGAASSSQKQAMAETLEHLRDAASAEATE